MQQNKLSILQQYFGYRSFREGQEQLIESILTGRDCLGIMPTGAGKSICFQVPAISMSGITLVISPLISLMKDQVSTLSQSGIKAAFINSSLSERQIWLALNYARNGLYKIIYVAPERLEDANFLDFAKNADISMLTVDEAHCISQWGQDFRPSYVKIVNFLKCLPKRPVVSAFTATATPTVREDIVNMLELSNPDILVTGFDRKNLYFEVQKTVDKFMALLDFLSDKKDKYGIVYCATRNAVEEVCEKLNQGGYNASRYHAGLSDKERHDNQDDFLYDRVQIMVATNAFGMGIDKSNVNFVIHYNMPKNIESYYQEAGRAGRDGEDADCILLYSAQDVRTNMFLIENSKDTVYPDAETENTLKDRDRKRLKEMTFYCHTTDCLRSYILKYFAEKPTNFCGNCSNCNTNFESIDVTIDAQKIASCVLQVRERFGVKMVVDVLRGSKNERIMRLGLEKLSSYNRSTLSEKRLRDIINHLVLNEYLVITNDEYPILKLGVRSDEILNQHATIEMKLVRDKEKSSKTPKKTIKTNHVDNRLFEKLRTLRLEIAAEQKVPAFVIFADSTLIDMCMKLPTNDKELLQVSGVGQVKLEHYGYRFLNSITEFMQGNTISKNQLETPKTFRHADIEVSDEAVTVSTIADRINCILMQSGNKKLSGMKINDWLVGEGYLKVVSDEKGKNSKQPTGRGMQIDITSEKRIIRGSECLINYFGRAAQQLIVDKLDDILV